MNRSSDNYRKGLANAKKKLQNKINSIDYLTEQSTPKLIKHIFGKCKILPSLFPAFCKTAVFFIWKIEMLEGSFWV